MNTAEDIFIVSAKRTPIGAFQGQLSSLTAVQLGAAVLKSLMQEHSPGSLTPDEVLMGCVLTAGLGQAPARQAARLAGLDDQVACTTVNKVCASGMKAVMLGHDMLVAGSAKCVLAGGMESMSNAPYLLPQARTGYRLGHQQVLDHMSIDGLENADDGKLMGLFAEQCVDRFGFSRALQDEYATVSVKRAALAMIDGDFDAEICSLEVAKSTRNLLIKKDELPPCFQPEKIPGLKAAFRSPGGTVTAASSAAIADGAAALLLCPGDRMPGDCQPLARLVAHASHGQPPSEFTTAPIGVINKLYAKTGWTDKDVDLYEINEAFAAVVLAAMRVLNLDPEKVNVNGGSCALGHPLGATGARLLVTLVHALKRRQLKRGIAALCIGGGEATGVAVELL